MMPKLPEPDLYAHELISNEGGIFLGCANLDVVKQSHVDGETCEKINVLFSESSVRAIQEEAYRAGMSAAVPAGWKVVPVVPTQTMLYTVGSPGEYVADMAAGFMKDIWSAMLAVSPEVK